MSEVRTTIRTEHEMMHLASALAKCMTTGSCIYLHGLLGAGKTTFVRGFLRGLGYQHKVKSPTYTLVEPYEIAGKQIYHFDLYRINDPEELQHIGISEYFNSQSICLVEWPEQGDGYLPSADMVCEIEFVKEGREVTCKPVSEQGVLMLEQFASESGC